MPTPISWLTSDATSNPGHPPNLYPAPPHTLGPYNYSVEVRPIDPDYHRWCKHEALWVAKELGLPVGEYQLDGFPQGYSLYCHCKGGEVGFKKRKDYYLYGSKHVLCFRSPNEFLPHARWLLQGAVPGTCECKYCSHTTQTAVNDKFGFPKRSWLA
ncbi:hypothetical protein BDV93DRAFT_542441 [Ceratobasidium sp. AG-I]|nr:hypothetical protein BDV93DRAFT_542441 [Ceratobasidium sp. AG-I]